MCRALGIDDVDGFMARTSVDQLAEWMAAIRLDPLPEERVEFMLAQLTAIVANKLRGKDEQAYRAADFMPKWGATKADVEADRQQRLRAKMDMVRMGLRG